MSIRDGHLPLPSIEVGESISGLLWTGNTMTSGEDEAFEGKIGGSLRFGDTAELLTSFISECALTGS